MNITNNPFEDFEAIIVSLKTLPALKVLSLDLQVNDEVELVLTSLKGLEVLNDQGKGKIIGRG